MEDENVPAMVEILSTGLTLQHQQWDSLDAKAGSYLAGSFAVTALFVGWVTQLTEMATAHEVGLLVVGGLSILVAGFSLRAIRATTVDGIPRIEYMTEQMATPRAPAAWATSLANACKANEPRLEAKARRVNTALYLLGGQIASALVAALAATL